MRPSNLPFIASQDLSGSANLKGLPEAQWQHYTDAAIGGCLIE